MMPTTQTLAAVALPVVISPCLMMAPPIVGVRAGRRTGINSLLPISARYRMDRRRPRLCENSDVQFARRKSFLDFVNLRTKSAGDGYLKIVHAHRRCFHRRVQTSEMHHLIAPSSRIEVAPQSAIAIFQALFMRDMVGGSYPRALK